MSDQKYIVKTIQCGPKDKKCPDTHKTDSMDFLEQKQHSLCDVIQIVKEAFDGSGVIEIEFEAIRIIGGCNIRSSKDFQMSISGIGSTELGGVFQDIFKSDLDNFSFKKSGNTMKFSGLRLAANTAMLEEFGL